MQRLRVPEESAGPVSDQPLSTLRDTDVRARLESAYDSARDMVIREMETEAADLQRPILEAYAAGDALLSNRDREDDARGQRLVDQAVRLISELPPGYIFVSASAQPGEPGSLRDINRSLRALHLDPVTIPRGTPGIVIIDPVVRQNLASARTAFLTAGAEVMRVSQQGLAGDQTVPIQPIAINSTVTPECADITVWMARRMAEELSASLTPLNLPSDSRVPYGDARVSPDQLPVEISVVTGTDRVGTIPIENVIRIRWNPQISLSSSELGVNSFRPEGIQGAVPRRVQ